MVDLSPDPHYINSVCNQSMPWWKALAELVDNAIDAGASQIKIAMKGRVLTVSDDGRGAPDVVALFRMGKHQEHGGLSGIGTYGIGCKDAWLSCAERHGSNQHEEKVDGPKGPSTIEVAAEALNVSPRSVKRAKQVQRDGVDELQQAMERDEVPVSLAAEFVKAVPDKAQQEKVIEAGKKTGDLRKAVHQEVKQRKQDEPKAAPRFNEDREGDRLAEAIRLLLARWPEDKQHIASDIIRIVLDEFSL